MAVTVVYDLPVTTAGSTTPAPSTQQSPRDPTSTTPFNEVRGRLVGDGSTTQVVITHNLGLTTAELSRDFPKVGLENILDGNPVWWVSARAANTVTISFHASFTNAVTAFVFNVERPYGPTR